MTDIRDPRLLYAKGGLFVVLGLLASATLLALAPDLRVAVLLAVAIWAFARAYYFAFYVVEHYVDPGFRFAGLGAFAAYLWNRRGRSGTRIFHVVEGERWRAIGETDDYSGDTLATEGFIHCSTAEQVPFVLDRFFRGRSGLVLLEIAPSQLRSELRWEESEPGRLFPHVYGPITRKAIVGVAALGPGQPRAAGDRGPT